MLTANETIAEKFYWLDTPFIYRVHEEPDIDKVKELNKFLFNLGLKIKTKDDHVYSKEFAKILEEIKGTNEEKVISTPFSSIIFTWSLLILVIFPSFKATTWLLFP